MSCGSCGSITHVTSQCYEARLSLGLKNDATAIIGSLDGIGLAPILLRPAVEKLETNTSLKYDPNLRALVYDNEKSKKGTGSANYVTSQEILAGAELSELGGVGDIIEGGLASVNRNGTRLELGFQVPAPIETGEVSGGFITYVALPNAGTSHYKLIKPDTSGTSDSLLIGHPNGTVEFSAPITSPIVIPATSLTSAGAFSGAPNVASGTWRYQTMGTSSVVQNTSRSNVAVTLKFRFSLETAGSHSGVYASLISGGADYQSNFIEGGNSLKQEGYPGGIGEWTTTLAPNQKCQFTFGAWTNASGNMVATIGSIDENAGSTIHTVQLPTITIRRLI